MNADVNVLILAGGSGTRFWPASRSSLPKQLLALSGDAPMIRQTMTRVLPMLNGVVDKVWIATGRATEKATREMLPEVAAERFLVEPVARNTAPCIAWAAEVIGQRAPDDIVVVLPSDHHVADEPGFRRVLQAAIDAARTGKIVTLGIKPTRPDTGFGYIELEAPSAFDMKDVKPENVLRFVEKPNKETAEKFLASGKYVWNAGMFIFRAGDMMRAVREHLADAVPLLADLATCEVAALERSFPKMPAVSIDVGIMEKEKGLLVVPGDFGWSDVGSWLAAWELADKDEQGNTKCAAVVNVGSKNNHVVSLGDSKRVIALLGVEGMAVVDTGDALLVMPLEKAQEVRAIVDALKTKRADLV